MKRDYIRDCYMGLLRGVIWSLDYGSHSSCQSLQRYWSGPGLGFRGRSRYETF